MYFAENTINANIFTHRLNGLLQPKDLLLEQVQGAGLATVAGKCGGTGAMDTVHPVLQLHLQRINRGRMLKFCGGREGEGRKLKHCCKLQTKCTASNCDVAPQRQTSILSSTPES